MVGDKRIALLSSGCRPDVLLLDESPWLRGQESNLHALRRLVNSQLGYQLPNLGMVPEEGVEPHLWLFRPTLLPVELSRHLNGAGGENRTLILRLETSHSAIELHLLEPEEGIKPSSEVYKTTVLSLNYTGITKSKFGAR